MSVHAFPQPAHRHSALNRAALRFVVLVLANVCGGFLAYVAYANYPALHICEVARP